MKLVHTADWHVGKMLRGDRVIEEHRAVLAEIAEITAPKASTSSSSSATCSKRRRRRPKPNAWSTTRCSALRATGAHVVVVGGNHDQPSQLERCAGVRPAGITVLGLPDISGRRACSTSTARRSRCCR